MCGPECAGWNFVRLMTHPKNYYNNYDCEGGSHLKIIIWFYIFITFESFYYQFKGWVREGLTLHCSCRRGAEIRNPNPSFALNPSFFFFFFFRTGKTPQAIFVWFTCTKKRFSERISNIKRSKFRLRRHTISFDWLEGLGLHNLTRIRNVLIRQLSRSISKNVLDA